MSLQDQIDQASREIASDGYPMSIGELFSLYRDKEIDLHPEFQRFYRWKKPQKSRLVESVLIGIPLPSIFVYQRKDGVWDVVDGMQRLSTLLEVAGELCDEDGKKLPQLELGRTRYLPDLEGKFWDVPDAKNSLTDIQRRLIKRSKLDIKIIKNDTSETSKYELFQRLNTGGSVASDQEVRNCLMIMTNRDLFQWLETLSTDEHFVNCTALSSRQLEERYDLELILRFITFKDLPNEDLAFDDLGDYLTARMLLIAEGKVPFDREETETIFRRTFATLDTALADLTFRRYNRTKDAFQGSFSISSFEAVTLGLAARYQSRPVDGEPTDLVGLIKAVWNSKIFQEYSGSGVRASTRIPRTVPLGREVFA